MNESKMLQELERDRIAFSRMRQIEIEPLQKKISQINKRYNDLMRKSIRGFLEYVCMNENIVETALDNDDGEELLHDFYEVYINHPDAVHPGALIHQLQDFIEKHKNKIISKT